MEESSLTKTARSLRSEFTILILFIVAVGLTAYLIYSFTRQPQQDKPKIATFGENIIPGETTKDQVESLLGEPLSRDNLETDEIFIYPTNNEFRENKIEFSGEKVSLIKEEVVGREKGLLRDFQESYGAEETILYSEHASFTPGYFWGSSGLMVFANRVDGIITEIWYFPPTTKERFLDTQTEFSDEERPHPEEF